MHSWSFSTNKHVVARGAFLPTGRVRAKIYRLGPVRKEFGPDRPLRAGPGLRAARPVQTSNQNSETPEPIVTKIRHR